MPVANTVANTDELFRLDKVSFHVGQNKILTDISLTLSKGEMVSLIGPNGAGKSTLVKLILGLNKPTSGDIIKHNSVISYVPQKFSVPSILPLRVKDLLAQANTKRLTPDERDFVLQKLSLAPLLDRQIHHLSGGETQRVLMARALLDKPDLLILDEPMQGLDPDSEELLYDFIDSMPPFLACAMLVVSHDLHWVMKGTRRVVCLNKHICCQGVPSDIAHLPEFVALFGQYHSTHQTPYIHHHDHCQHTH
ncbi:Zinc import ATP-binding protein ZnuC [Moraxella lacunata]|uniref:Zinc import ATP-binding protein ZnuC n=1 Tax=Moraxella lacunata TaxID=477 RepID=A0A378TR78_MORLA|nr:metal ABC transporter ATP-binding protein [Moraxella lacunata]STZ63296.1 Zinc import ATP-binding protein ZnuC [Moraxella lacunata]